LLDGNSEFVRALYYNVTVSRYTKSLLRSLLEAANQSVSSLPSREARLETLTRNTLNESEIRMKLHTHALTIYTS